MPEEVKRKRGRPPKNKTTIESVTENISEVNSSIPLPDSKSYEFNSYNASDVFEANNFLFNCGIYNYFSENQIKCILQNPVDYHEEAIRLSNFVYTKNGIVSNSIDYMTALPCLDRIVTNRSKKNSNKLKKNKELMMATLKTIDDKSFIRDAIHTEMREGIAFYYFDTRKKVADLNKFMNDYDVNTIYEINEVGVNAAILTLPWEYTKIVGKKNNRYVLAFNLRYFDEFTGDNLTRKLKKYPKEIVDGYYKRKKESTGGDWLVLDNDKTMCKKIKSKDSEPWGRSLIIAALEDVLYKDYFIDTKRNVLNEINNKIIYQTFPESDKKGLCALNKEQQQAQHNAVKNAVLNKNNRGGTSFFSVAAGTKINSIDVNLDIFDSKNETDLNNNIAMDLGICASLIGAMTTGNFSAGQNNLEMITAQIYTWVYEWQNELNYVINQNIIQDDRNKVEVYYFPTSFVNRKGFFDMCRSLFMEAGGSLSFLIASAGIDVDAYMGVLDQEIEDGVFGKYKPHETSYTLSSKEQGSEAGRPETENPTNENTIISKSNGANNLPSPSDNKQ